MYDGDMALSALIGGGMSLGGSLYSASQSKKAAKRLIQWQDLLSRTQYQRMTKDMRAAGLNPVLGVSSGGNAVPGGAMPKVPDFGTTMASGATVGTQARVQKSTVKNTEAIAVQNEAQAKVSKWIIDKIESDPDFKNMFTGASAANNAGLPAWLGLPLEQMRGFFEKMRKANKGSAIRNKTTINQSSPFIPMHGPTYEVTK